MAEWKQRQPLLEIDPFDEILDQLLKVRGIKDKESFLNPGKEFLHNPYLMKNMDKATDRIIKAIRSNEKIGISWDIDVDGLTSGSMMFNYLSRFTDNVFNLYHERSQGHGVSKQLDHIDPRTNLLIVIDSSSNELNECKEISNRGIDIVILDHHPCTKNPYTTLVNPQQDGCEYPNKNLSAAGVVYKTFQALDTKLKVDYADMYTDLASVGLIGDAMNLSNMENRAIINHGLDNINNVGLQALLWNKGIKESDTSSIRLSYEVIPIMNSAARMDQIHYPIELLSVKTHDEAKEIVKQMNRLNTKRKKITDEFVEKFKQEADTNSKVIIATSYKLSAGLNGLIAQVLTKEFNRPAIVLKEHKNGFSGSMRSFNDFNLRDFLQESKQIKYCQGHPQAAGVGLNKDQLPKLRKYIEENLDFEVDDTIYYDIEISAEEYTEDALNQVLQFNRISGNGFPEAAIKVTDLMVEARNVRGKEAKKVVTFTFNQVSELNGCEVIKFNADEDFADEVNSFSNVEVVGGLSLNVFPKFRNQRFVGDKVTRQVIMQDYKLLEDANDPFNDFF